MKYILYGAGHVGKVAEDFFGTDNVKKVLVSVPDNKKEVKFYNMMLGSKGPSRPVNI